MEHKKVIILGGKGTAVVIAEQIIDAHEKYNVPDEFIGYAFDDESFGGSINGYPILSKTTEVYAKYKNYNDVYFVFQLYRSDLIKERAILFRSFNIPDNRIYTFIHPSCYIAKSALIKTGNCICAHTVVNPNVKIGLYNTINSNSLIGHDSQIGNFNFIAGHSCIGSNVLMDAYNFIGLNSSIKNYVKIGQNNIIGMGSNLLHDTESDSIFVGNPARRTGDKKQ